MRPYRVITSCAILGYGCLAALGGSSPVPRLKEPVMILADGAPITVERGHASPFVADMNGDGKKDLLVGQFGGGKCRVYLNGGTDGTPQFGEFSYLQAGGCEASVPPT